MIVDAVDVVVLPSSVVIVNAGMIDVMTTVRTIVVMTDVVTTVGTIVVMTDVVTTVGTIVVTTDVVTNTTTTTDTITAALTTGTDATGMTVGVSKVPWELLWQLPFIAPLFKRKMKFA